jgi:acylphosphatase
MAKSEVRARCLFRGLVQGVCFRAYTQRFALQAGVSGWVRNLYSGDVEAVFQGEKDRVEEAIRMCREEQPHARVSSVDISWEDPGKETEGFRIVH